MSRIRSKLTYANVMVTILAFVVLGGGTALAAYVVSSNSQIGPGTVSGHRPPSGKHQNIIAGSISGTDIADRSGVDTCKTPLTKKFGPICAGSDGVGRGWIAARDYCAGLNLRLPSIGEANALAINYDVPGGDAAFWTDDKFAYVDNGVGHINAWFVSENGGSEEGDQGQTHQTVCVTDPSA
jgi:hypothetical protein